MTDLAGDAASDGIHNFQLSDARDDLVAFLALSSVRGIGYWSLYKLAGLKVRWAELLRNTPEPELVNLLHQVGAKLPRDGSFSIDRRRHVWQDGISLLKELHSHRIQLLLAGHPHFPPALTKAPEPAHWLFVQGETGLLSRSNVAVVGTRRPSTDGTFLAYYITAALSSMGTVIVSGMAEGIDEAVHRAALRFHVPSLGVLGHGLLSRSQVGDQALKERVIADGGALVSEYLPYQSYSAENFVRRNRLQVALARAVIAVEWNAKSGTAHTVRFGLAAGRKVICLAMPDCIEREELQMARAGGAEIFAVPGDEPALLHTILQAVSLTGDMVSSSPQISLFDSIEKR